MNLKFWHRRKIENNAQPAAKTLGQRGIEGCLTFDDLAKTLDTEEWRYLPQNYPSVCIVALVRKVQQLERQLEGLEIGPRR